MAGNETAEAQTLVPIPSLVITGNLKYRRHRFWAFPFIDSDDGTGGPGGPLAPKFGN